MHPEAITDTDSCWICNGEDCISLLSARAHWAGSEAAHSCRTLTPTQRDPFTKVTQCWNTRRICRTKVQQRVLYLQNNTTFSSFLLHFENGWAKPSVRLWLQVASRKADAVEPAGEEKVPRGLTLVTGVVSVQKQQTWLWATSPWDQRTDVESYTAEGISGTWEWVGQTQERVQVSGDTCPFSYLSNPWALGMETSQVSCNPFCLTDPWALLFHKLEGKDERKSISYIFDIRI